MRWWRRPLAWDAPADVELGLIGRASVASGVAWWLGDLASVTATPLLAVATALVVIQASARSTLRMAVARTVAVVVGAGVGIAIGDVVALRGVTIALLVAIALLLADFLLRLPLAAARQVPMVLVLAIAASTYDSTGSIRARVAQTIVGAVVGASVTLLWPVSRVKDRRRALVRRASTLRDAWTSVAVGLADAWTVEDADRWRHQASAAASGHRASATSELEVAVEAMSWTYRRHRDAAALETLQRWARWLDAVARSVEDLTDDLVAAALTSGVPQAPWPGAATASASIAATVDATVAHATDRFVPDAVGCQLAGAATPPEPPFGPATVAAGAVDEVAVLQALARTAARLTHHPWPGGAGPPGGGRSSAAA
jgi:uncharacterized membrane protein YgaE (UPF0421/DUF939 family)